MTTQMWDLVREKVDAEAIMCRSNLNQAKLTHLFEDADLDNDQSLSLAEWEKLLRHPDTFLHVGWQCIPSVSQDPKCFLQRRRPPTVCTAEVPQMYISRPQEIVHYLSTLEVDVHDARMLFQLLDAASAAAVPNLTLPRPPPASPALQKSSDRWLQLEHPSKAP